VELHYWFREVESILVGQLKLNQVYKRYYMKLPSEFEKTLELIIFLAAAIIYGAMEISGRFGKELWLEAAMNLRVEREKDLL
jgi:hypothetical protein